MLPMLRTRADLEELEARTLASYAMPSRASQGRRVPEPPHPMRTCFQRDRDRIIHCAAFRRLEYKTQVFVNHEGDYYRTRLTHTIEAAQITRTVAQALGLNRDLAEAVALRQVFKAADPGPLVTGIKAGMGHISGGAGLLNLVIALEAIRSGTLPGISDLTDPIEETKELRVISGAPATGSFGTAQVHAIGMGGINAVAIVEGAAQ